MGLFGKKNTKSTLRFCQTAVELETSHLFSDWDLTLAISKLSEWHNHGLEATREANAYGVVHTIYGHGQPLLPVSVCFSFSPPYTERDPGHGSIWKTDRMESNAHYQADITIHDPDRRIYTGFRVAFEHALMSGNVFAHLILRREKTRYINDPQERDAKQKAERERLKKLMIAVEDGTAEMPGISFDRVAWDDTLILKGPSWSHEWHDDILNRPKYHSSEAAKWRNMPWRK